MPLTDVEVRILGSLIEKEATTPDNYPLSLNALTTACNQSSNRDPVMELADDTVRWAVNSLRQQSLVRAIQPSDSRVMKFQHLVREKLGVEGPELAVLCVLLLRGAQTPGELRGRTGRMADFTSVAEVEEVIHRLVARELVAELPRRRGQKELRYAHLLAGPPAVDATPAMDTTPTTAATPERALDHDAPPTATFTNADAVAALERRVEQLESELAALRREFDAFRQQFG